MSSNARREEIKRLREEGRAAYMSCIPRNRNPYKSDNGMHWDDGWDSASAEAQNAVQEQENEERYRLIRTIDNAPTWESLKPVLRWLVEHSKGD